MVLEEFVAREVRPERERERRNLDGGEDDFGGGGDAFDALLWGRLGVLLRKFVPAFTTQEDVESRKRGVGIRRRKRWPRGTTLVLVVRVAALLIMFICEGGIQGARRCMRPVML